MFSELKQFRLFAMLVVTLFALYSVGPIACNDDDDTSSTDGDTDSDTDSDVEFDTDPNTTCIRSVSGKVVFDNGAPMQGDVQICVPSCMLVNTDENGDFVKNLVEGSDLSCMNFDFISGINELHITLLQPNGTHADYSTSYAPTQEEVSDQGHNDVIFDVGTLILYELPAEGVPYNAQNGATVEMSGLSFEMPPGSLIAKDGDIDKPVDKSTIKILKAPADWDAPFDEIGLDALYFIGPYWAELAKGGVPLHIDPPDGWTDGDIGVVYILSEAMMGLGASMGYITEVTDQCANPDDPCPGCLSEDDPLSDYANIGELTDCGTAVFKDGKVVTAPIPRFGWIGIERQ